MTAGNTSQKEVHLLLYSSILWRGLFFASSFLVNILFARFYQASASGLVFYAVTYYTLFIQVLGFSLESGLGFYAAKKAIAASRLITFSLAATMVTGIVVAIFFSWYIPLTFYGISRPFIILSATAFICGNLLTAYTSGIFYAYRNFHVPNIICICINLLLVVFLLIRGLPSPGTAMHTDIFIHLFFYSYLLQGIVLLAALVTGYADGGRLSFPGTAELKNIWRYSLQASVSNLAFFMLYRIDYWFVQKYCSANDLGNYIQVSKIAQLFLLLPTVIASVVFPLTAGGGQKEINRNLKGIAFILLCISGTGCMLLAIAGYWLFPFVYGTSFTGMYIPFLLLMPGILSLSALCPFTAYFAGKNRIGVNIKGALLALLVVIAGDILVIPACGTAGAALVSSIGYITYLVYVLLFYKKEQQLTLAMLLKIGNAERNQVRRFIALKIFKEMKHEQL